MDLVNKYRPTRLSEVIGQKAAVNILRGVFKNREDINPVTLFCGPHSTGKTTLAWLLALYSNCQDPQDEGEACRECDSCQSILAAIQAGTDGRSVIEKPVSERGIDAIRTLETWTRYKAQDRYRWIILDEVHNLTKPAFDAALRLLEKPQGQTRFVLCTTAPEALPGTIRSRNWVYNLQAIEPKTTARQLLWKVVKKEKLKGIDQKAVQHIADKVNGHPRDALNLLAQWAAAIEGGVTPEEAPRVMGAIEAVQPYAVIQQYCKAILTGKLNHAFKALQHCSSHEYFVGQVLELLREVLYRWLSNEHFARARYDRDIQVVGVPKQKFVIPLGQVIELLLNAQDRIKQYRCDNQAVLEAATIEAVVLVKQALKA